MKRAEERRNRRGQWVLAEDVVGDELYWPRLQSGDG
jgi:hypothetical protein